MFLSRAECCNLKVTPKNRIIRLVDGGLMEMFISKAHHIIATCKYFLEVAVVYPLLYKSIYSCGIEKDYTINFLVRLM